jgi:hypothetical protein
VRRTPDLHRWSAQEAQEGCCCHPLRSHEIRLWPPLFADRTGEGVCCEGFWYKKVLDLAQPVRRHLHPLFAARTTAEPLFPISPSSCHQGMLAALPRLPRPALTLGCTVADAGLWWAAQYRQLPPRHHLTLLEFIRQGLGCQGLRDPVCLPASNSDPCAP